MHTLNLPSLLLSPVVFLPAVPPSRRHLLQQRLRLRPLPLQFPQHPCVLLRQLPILLLRLDVRFRQALQLLRVFLDEGFDALEAVGAVLGLFLGVQVGFRELGYLGVVQFRNGGCGVEGFCQGGEVDPSSCNFGLFIIVIFCGCGCGCGFAFALFAIVVEFLARILAASDDSAVPVLKWDDVLCAASGAGCVAELAVEPLGFQMLEFFACRGFLEEVVPVEAEELGAVPCAFVRVFGLHEGPPFLADVGGRERYEVAGGPVVV